MAHRCPQCDQLAPDDAQFCPNPACGTYLGWHTRVDQIPVVPDHDGAPAQRAATYPRESPRHPPSRETPRVSPPRAKPAGERPAHVATLAPERVDVAPGGSVALTVTVHNTGSVVDEVEVVAGGPLAAYTTVDPASTAVYPGDRATVQVVVRPPHAVSPPAGVHPLVLRVASSRGGTVSEHAALVEIGAFTGMAARLVPPASQGTGTRVAAAVEVANRGNSMLHATVAPRDDQGRVRFPRGVAHLQVPPGTTGRAQVPGRTRLNWLGEPDELAFDVTVTADADPVGHAPPVGERLLPGRRTQLALLASWRGWLLVLAALGAATLALVVAVGPLVVDAVRTVADRAQDALQDDPPLESGGEEQADPDAEPQPEQTPNENAQFCQEAAQARQELEARGLDQVTAQETVQVVQIGATGTVDDRLVAFARTLQEALGANDADQLRSTLDEVAELCGR